MDKMVLRHYWKDLKKIGLQLLVRDDIENSDTAVGVQFRSPVWANFLREFFISNKDASLRMQNDVIKDLKHKVNPRSLIVINNFHNLTISSVTKKSGQEFHAATLLSTSEKTPLLWVKVLLF